MITFTEYLNEASYPQRAWDGRLKKINQLIQWLYEKKIMNAGERKEWDKVVRNYYRYYNDGDAPRIIKGVSKYTPANEIEPALEEKLEEFIKKVLSKYQGKYNRTDFRLDTAISKAQQVIKVCDTSDEYFSSTSVIYWIKDAFDTNNEEIKELLTVFEEAIKKFKEEVSKVVPSYPNKVEGSIIKELKKNSLINLKIEKAYKKVEHACDEIIFYCRELIEAYTKAKTIISK